MHLDLLAADMGVSICEAYLPHGWWGAYSHRTRTITLRPDLAPIQYRSTLAHELGHAWHGHRESTPRTEWQASIWSAKLLIRHQDYMEAVLAADHPQGVACLLEVLPRDVEMYTAGLGPAELLEMREAMAVKSV